MGSFSKKMINKTGRSKPKKIIHINQNQSIWSILWWNSHFYILYWFYCVSCRQTKKNDIHWSATFFSVLICVSFLFRICKCHLVAQIHTLMSFLINFNWSIPISIFIVIVIFACFIKIFTIWQFFFLMHWIFKSKQKIKLKQKKPKLYNTSRIHYSIFFFLSSKVKKYDWFLFFPLPTTTITK